MIDGLEVREEKLLKMDFKLKDRLFERVESCVELYGIENEEDMAVTRKKE